MYVAMPYIMRGADTISATYESLSGDTSSNPAVAGPLSRTPLWMRKPVGSARYVTIA